MSDLLECIEINPPSDAATASVIWLHGLGADGHDFEPIPPLLGLPNTRFILPHADRRPVTINGGFVMRAWYDILSLDFKGVRESESDIRKSQAQIEALIQRERDRGVPSERIAVVGFSQGGAMALHVGLRWGEPLAGVIVLSAYLLMTDKVAVEQSAANATTPMLFCHGTQDPMVPMWLGKAAHDQVEALNPARPMEWFDYPMQHAVCPEELAEIARFLHARLG
ncbi:alpha/beta hydrolase [Enhygromyxa salina]|uniref:Carboxylesterase 2 n=1 Tax=Enhygromyxa salina TaxID=215803 RepID=A0A2S9YU84_9BACT|nr:alpha/beta fold hydrolase [Enhygromyxa salina]PRQ08656.1 Carboxylesterase 2 [Enhygromyxa salina]